MKRVVIIGSGITGLAAAHRVLERSRESGQRVALAIIEASPSVGGIVQTHAREGFLLESGPDSFISEKPAALDLVKRLGLESHLIQTASSNFPSTLIGVAVRDTSYTGKSRDCAPAVMTVAETMIKAMTKSDSLVFIMMGFKF